ncbi:hypothetical protein C8F04DRAFT_1268367 [Mycena alexandri]|uniref:Uncharacterized protein n=1 Tax=Mycena alexandri TaxID=1745969 RepID=A0AAD6WVC9_9AGAR|nr:hypothetical protein C8F04DRAFT_1268367 [Mycena alexandri]
MDDSPQDDDHWTIAWTNALDTYLKDVDARKELEENAPKRRSYSRSVTDGEAPEGAWASMRYMHDLTAERQEMGAGMRETGDYHDYLRNKRHTFTPEERKHNDKMWADRREARLKHRRKAFEAQGRCLRGRQYKTRVPGHLIAERGSTVV